MLILNSGSQHGGHWLLVNITMYTFDLGHFILESKDLASALQCHFVNSGQEVIVRKNKNTLMPV